jgi:vancomycin resistance protein VanJ
MNLYRDNQQLDSAVAEILAQGADVVALQEVTEETGEQVARALAAQYPYQDFDGDLAFLSKLPLTSSGPLQDARGRWATLDVGGRTIALVNVHLHRRALQTRRLPGLSWLPIPRDFNTTSQQVQVASLLAELKGAQLPYVLVGDFNLPDRDPAYAMLAEQLHDAYRTTEPGFGFTYPGKRSLGPVDLPFPVLRIDYVWSSQEIEPVRTRVNCAGGSDHCMVIADLAVNADQR